QADVTKAADNEALVKKAVETFGGLHIFFANAGVGGTPTLFWELEEKDFDFVMNVNTKAIWLGMKASMPAMMQSGGGSFISTSSLAGVMGSPKASVYSASKHAVVGLMKSAAGEAARFNIRYNSIHPGPIETDMVRDLEKSISRKDPDKGMAFLTGRIPMRRYGTADEVADLALFLASDDSKYITGCSLRIDGGMSAM
ncbi:MAG: SDR family NAD(P)-dependent oxidoreductase, partial [Bacteroidota bacterium]